MLYPYENLFHLCWSFLLCLHQVDDNLYFHGENKGLNINWLEIWWIYVNSFVHLIVWYFTFIHVLWHAASGNCNFSCFLAYSIATSIIFHYKATSTASSKSFLILHNNHNKKYIFTNWDSPFSIVFLMISSLSTIPNNTNYPSWEISALCKSCASARLNAKFISK